ncbi:MAG TPA: hypothetical protein VFI23_14715 [Rhizomicrobium sp.]|nr:hypothetical protein [Rhizomicrobium sp.]
MNLDRIHNLIEQLRKEIVGPPEWVKTKGVFEYKNQSLEVVVILKLVRAAQGLTALDVLCRAGLFVDLGAAIRSVNDCVEEVYFLLETYPGKSGPMVDQFVKGFFENTIDGYLDTETHQVPRGKIRSAVVRVLKGNNDNATQELVERIYKTFCGYVHANYAHLMEVYNGGADDYNLGGVPSVRRREGWMQHVELATNAVAMAAAFAAQKFKHDTLHAEFLKLVT